MFSNIMSRDRFQQILACLHLCINQEQPARDHPEYKFFKLGNLGQLLNEIFTKRYKLQISYCGGGRRPAEMNEVPLVGKHYPES